MAQFTFALLLEVVSQVGLHNHLVHDGKWSQVPDFTFWNKPLLELKGKTLGLVGYGHIAQKVAEIGHAFSMKILFYNHHPKSIAQAWAQQVSLDDLLNQSDIISLHVIQTPETVNLINTTSIQKMRDGVILVNTARGKLINESDVANALNNGKIYALATDAVQSEPIHPDNLLLRAKNCFITPHIAWAPLETRTRLLDITLSNLKAFLTGGQENRIV